MSVGSRPVSCTNDDENPAGDSWPQNNLQVALHSAAVSEWNPSTKVVKEADPERRPSASAFIPVVAAECSRSTALDAPRGEDRLAKRERTGHLSSPGKVNASLPNGVKLMLDCSDMDALTAIIGAFGHVQTGR